MLRHFATVSLGTLTSRLTGFLRDAMIAALLGAGTIADIFLIAFQIVTVARRLIGEGALNAALVPAWLRTRSDAGDGAAAAFAGRVLATLTLALVALALAIGLAAPCLVDMFGAIAAPERSLAAADMRLMLPYIAFAGPVAVMMALLNAQQRFAFTAFAPLTFNVLLIGVAAALLLGGIRDPALASLILAATVGTAGLMQATVLTLYGRVGVIALAQIRPSLAPPMRAFFARALPGMIASAAPHLTMILGALLASAIPGAVSWLYFANRLIELPLGIVGVAMGTVMVPLVARTDDAAQARGAEIAMQVAVGLALPAALALAVLAQPITRVLFEHGAFTPADSAQTALALTVLAAGLPAQVLGKTWAAVFFGRGDTMTPLHATVAGLAATALAGLAGIRFGHAGIAAAMVAGTWVHAAWLCARLRRTGPLVDAAGAGRLLRLALATLAMGAVLVAATALMGPGASFAAAALRVAILIVAGLTVYALALRLLGVVTFDTARTALRKQN